MFEFEKEKTKFQLSIEHLKSQLQESQENLSRIQRKLEFLDKENVKLKSDIRQSKKTAYASGPGNYLAGGRLGTQFGNPEIVKSSLQGLPTPTNSGGFNSTFTGGNAKWEFKKKFISDGVLNQSIGSSEKGEEKLEGSSSTMSKEDEHYEEDQ